MHTYASPVSSGYWWCTSLLPRRLWVRIPARERVFSGLKFEEENPQVRKTGVDAVHGKLPTEVQYVKDCNMCVMMTET